MVKHPENGRLHKLLRGEMAAVESYEKAVADMGEERPRALLDSFLQSHRRAVSLLSDHIAVGGDEPDRSAGPWGAFVRAVESAASRVDDTITLKALKEGEVHGADEYRTALAMGAVPDELRAVVERELLPRQIQHIEELDELIARIERSDNQKSLPDRIRAKTRG